MLRLCPGMREGLGVRKLATICAGAAVALAVAGSAQAFDGFSFEAPGAGAALQTRLKAASLTQAAQDQGTTDIQEIFAAARADYARLIGALYDEGYYGPVISIRVNGREAAEIAALNIPTRLDSVAITVIPGPQFHFSRAEIDPVAAKTVLPEGYRAGQIASSGVIVKAATAAVEGWRDDGHAKARVAAQSLTAQHRDATLDARITLDPGPVLTFGKMQMQGYERMRPERIAAIAGFPAGKRYSPERLDEVRTRLRRTGIFSSVSLTEDEAIGPGNTLDTTLAVVEEKPRRFGFGAELSTTEGLNLSGYWLHRNLLGGGERLRFDAEVTGIGGTNGAADYSLGARLDRPATFTPDTSAYLETLLEKTSGDDYDETSFRLGFGLDHIFNPRLTGSAGVAYGWSKVTDASGQTFFRQIALPLTATWDNRDSATDATRGYYGKLELTPFYGLSDTGSGARLSGDFRAYRALDAEARFVLAGRAQIGGVFGPSLEDTPRDYLFYSGGGGTVRGQPFESLGVNVLNGGTLRSGGARFLGFSGELRSGVTKSIGLVAFADAGYIGLSDYTSGEWHSGAGIGLRYKTGIGPIRLDIAGPVSGSTRDGAQIYLGIGQAF